MYYIAVKPQGTDSFHLNIQEITIVSTSTDQATERPQ